jgi:hypothetical protein
MIPEKLNKDSRDTIRKNQQTLVQHYNLHHLIMNIALGTNYTNKKMGLLGDLSFQTSCETADVKGDNALCTCF